MSVFEHGELIVSLTKRLVQDATLKRCFDKEEKIIDCTWEYISQQRTRAAPHEPMPRLKDLLEFLASPGLENVWLLLDIKVTTPYTSILAASNNDASSIMTPTTSCASSQKRFDP